MNLLDRYIFRSVLFSCATAVGLFSFVLMLGNTIKDLLGYVLAGQLPFGTFARLVWLLAPAVATYALPMGILTGVLLTLGRLSADSEITAMRTCGLSLLRIARPIFILAALGVAAGLYVNFESMPKARVQYHLELAEAVRTDPLRAIEPKTVIRDFPGWVVYVGDKQGGELHDVWLRELDKEGRAVQLTHAQSGHIDLDAETNELIVTLNHVQWERRNEKNPEDFSVPPITGVFESSQPVRLPLEGLFGRAGVRHKLQWMTYSELRAEQARLAALTVPPAEAREHERNRMKVSLTVQEKFTTALAVLSFALMGVPLGIKVSRRETSANLGVAIILALGYYFLTTAVGWLDRHPEYHPDVVLWLPNTIFLCLGVWLFRRIDRR